jgi:hypothetical protein
MTFEKVTLMNILFNSYVLLQYMVGKQWLHEAVPSHAWGVLSFQYSRSGVMRPIEIRRGQFLNDQEWYTLWTEEDSEDEDEVGDEDNGTDQ